MTALRELTELAAFIDRPEGVNIHDIKAEIARRIAEQTPAPYVPQLPRHFRYGVNSPHAPYGEGHRAQTDNGHRSEHTDGLMCCYSLRSWRFFHRLFRIRIRANELKHPSGFKHSFVRSR